ncbi:MAG: hypothetical protein CML29_16260 [Rhizobiales bacterium]|nr:hypothetical protein [Hyphomicrobiales bacterium]MBA70610.1 hypothetical protein [Hyphomicrobiales bacterium]|tara:strand:+ start:112 stop:948 length:837 start_codon:yes stop_codon:yes gene_type:complete
MKKFSPKLYLATSVLALAAFGAQAQTEETKVPEPMEGAMDMIKSAPAVVEDATKATADTADDAMDATADAASDAADATGEAMEATGEAMKDAGKEAADMAEDAAKKADQMAEDAADAVEKAVADEEAENGVSTDEAPAMTSEGSSETAGDKPDMESGTTDTPDAPAAGTDNSDSMDSSTNTMKTESEVSTGEEPMEDTTMEKPAMDDAAMEKDEPAMADTSSGEMEAGGHKIAAGDTLWDIAKAKYGDGRKWKAIRDANPGINPGNLKVGESLTLPEN